MCKNPLKTQNLTGDFIGCELVLPRVDLALEEIQLHFNRIQDVFKKRPNFRYKDFIAHFTTF